MPLAPSLFDLQINGYAGVDFQNPALAPADLRRAIDALRAGRTHRILLTLITDEIDALAGKFAQIEKYRAADPVLAETICGYHLEGPFLSPEEGYRGAHPGECMRAPDLAAFQRLQEAAGGNIRLLTIAPEWPGSAEFIAAVRCSGAVPAPERCSGAVSCGRKSASHAKVPIDPYQVPIV